jgi:hypothetical protein
MTTENIIQASISEAMEKFVKRHPGQRQYIHSCIYSGVWSGAELMGRAKEFSGFYQRVKGRFIDVLGETEVHAYLDYVMRGQPKRKHLDLILVLESGDYIYLEGNVLPVEKTGNKNFELK